MSPSLQLRHLMAMAAGICVQGVRSHGWHYVQHELDIQKGYLRKIHAFHLCIIGQECPIVFLCSYVDIADTGRSLYYIFAEARKNAADAPLVLWLNG